MATNTRTASGRTNRDKAATDRTATATPDSSDDAATTDAAITGTDVSDTDVPDGSGPDGAELADAEQAPAPDPAEWIDVVRLLAMMTDPAPTPDESDAAPVLWGMLSGSESGMTAGQMYARAEEIDDLPVIETATIKAVMGRYERVGLLRSDDAGKGRQRWTIATASHAFATIHAIAQQQQRPRTRRTSPMSMSATVTPPATPEGHWAQGALKATVAELLHANPHETFTATEVCVRTGIEKRKHGSVTHALGALVDDGEIVIASDGPKRWQSAQAA